MSYLSEVCFSKGWLSRCQQRLHLTAHDWIGHLAGPQRYLSLCMMFSCRLMPFLCPSTKPHTSL